MAALDELKNKTGELLDEGLRTGALTTAEHSWRKNHLPAAASAAELEALVEDLLVPAQRPASGQPAEAGTRGSLTCVLSSRTMALADLSQRTDVATILGSTHLDLTGLEPGRELVIEMAIVLGEAVVEVPEGVQVRVSVNPVLAELRIDPAVQSADASVRITGDVVLGTLRVVRRRAPLR